MNVCSRPRRDSRDGENASAEQNVSLSAEIEYVFFCFVKIFKSCPEIFVMSLRLWCDRIRGI